MSAAPRAAPRRAPRRRFVLPRPTLCPTRRLRRTCSKCGKRGAARARSAAEVPARHADARRQARHVGVHKGDDVVEVTWSKLFVKFHPIGRTDTDTRPDLHEDFPHSRRYENIVKIEIYQHRVIRPSGQGVFGDKTDEDIYSPFGSPEAENSWLTTTFSGTAQSSAAPQLPAQEHPRLKAKMSVFNPTGVRRRHRRDADRAGFGGQASSSPERQPAGGRRQRAVVAAGLRLGRAAPRGRGRRRPVDRLSRPAASTARPTRSSRTRWRRLLSCRTRARAKRTRRRAVGRPILDDSSPMRGSPDYPVSPPAGRTLRRRRRSRRRLSARRPSCRRSRAKLTVEDGIAYINQVKRTVAPQICDQFLGIMKEFKAQASKRRDRARPSLARRPRADRRLQQLPAAGLQDRVRRRPPKVKMPRRGSVLRRPRRRRRREGRADGGDERKESGGGS